MLSDLNPLQANAVTHLHTPLLVLAGAGSGKTRVIAYKIIHLIQHYHYKPHKIFAVTFTNKAAKEMNDRVKKLIGSKQSRGLQISTFHTLGLKVIKAEARHLNLKPNISIYDAEDSQNLLQDILIHQSSQIDDKISDLQHQISIWKSDGISPESALQMANTDSEFFAAKLYAEYQKKCQLYNAVDFDDLIYLPLKLLQNNSDVLERWQNKIQYLLVDEYQDTNQTQYELIKLLTGVTGKLTVVGDDHQSIYTWRGAKPENLQLLQRDFPSLHIIKLEQNYRSTNTILNAANHLIAHNQNHFEKSLWSTLGEGDCIRVISTRSEHDEASRVAAEILNHRFQYNLNFSNYAVLYRSNHQAQLLEKAFREHQIPYALSGGVSFFSRTEIKDILAYLKLIVNPSDDSAFLRIVNTPKRGIGPDTLEKLSYYASQRNISLMSACDEMGLEQVLTGKPLEKVRAFAHWITNLSIEMERDDPILHINKLLRTIDYENYLLEICAHPKTAEKKQNNVLDLVQWLKRIIEKDDAHLSLSDALTKMLVIEMITTQEKEQDQDKVQLLTLHAAKGLEYPHVYIIGLEDGLLPHQNSLDTNNLEEERRLAYVGITRAMRTLTLLLTQKRKKHGEYVDSVPSLFLNEIPKSLITWEGKEELSPKERIAKNKNHLSTIKAMLNAQD